MTELGARLKAAREAKGLSYEDLQELTKIQKRYLIGIEEGNYSIMPGAFYARAFIKQYADAVGLDSEQLLEEYKREVPVSSTPDIVKSVTTNPSKRTIKAASTNRMMETMPKIMLGLFIVVIIAIVWLLVTKKSNEMPPLVEEKPTEVEYEKNPSQEAEKEKAKAEAEAKEKAEAEAKAKAKAEEEAVTSQVISEGVVVGQDSTYEITGTEKLEIRVEVAGDTWLGIRDEVGNLQSEDRVFKAGETLNTDATEKGYARIRLGNANVAKVFINDEEIQYASDLTTQNIIIKLVKAGE